MFVLHHYPAFRVGLVSVLDDDPLLHCVGWAEGLVEALHTAPAAAPDLVVADAPDDTLAPATAHRLHRALPRARLLLLRSGRQPPDVNIGLPAGVCHQVARSVSAAELVDTLKRAHGGAAQAARLPPPGATEVRIGDDLTQRECSLLGLMARGMSNRDISRHLGIAMPTVKFHVTHILTKLHAGNRTSAVLVALRHQLVAIN